MDYISALPNGIRSRRIDNGNGLIMHVLEAGRPQDPCVLLLHGFPELAYSWRKVMLPIAQAGYYVIAPDQRGYGRTTGWDPRYHGDLWQFRILNIVCDAMGLISALGRDHVAAVFGHDFGSFVAGFCALLRPDVFRSLALMSAPFAGTAPLPFDSVNKPQHTAPDIHAALAALPRPRKHYQWYYSMPQADRDMWQCAQGVHDFLRAYYHHKSADWKQNQPHPLAGWQAEELAKMPTYYIMDLAETMAEAVAHEKPSAAEIAANTWLPDEELAVYAAEYGRIGFQGGLQWYRNMTSFRQHSELSIFAGRNVEVPSIYVAGKSDWGIYQRPGVFERMCNTFLTDMRGCHLIDGAGHWVQQEQAQGVSEILCDFLQQTRKRA